QKANVSGIVKNLDSEPLSGVTVRIKNGSQMATTSNEGAFSMEAQTGDILVFSLLGYDETEIVYTYDFDPLIILEKSVSALEEVVVVGYGSQVKKLVTGSVSKVDMEDTKNLPNTNFTQALRGRVAGVQFTDNGRPGQSGSFLIRGPRSL